MSATRRLLLSLLLALALVAGQQAAALHALAHATEQVGKGDPKAPPQPCEQCLAFSQLDGPAMGAQPLPAALGTLQAAATPVALPPGAAARLAFRSRAPPSAA